LLPRGVLDSLRPPTIERWKTELLAHGIKKPLTPTSVKIALKHMGVLYNYAKKLRYFSGANPFEKVAYLPVDEKPLKFLESHQIEDVLAAADNASR
jgi:site-specific recombinase XerD